MKEAWQAHNASVLRGDIVKQSDLRQPTRPSHGLVSSFDVGPSSTLSAYKRLGTNKGVGYDGIPAELLQAGESALACKFSAVNERIWMLSVGAFGFSDPGA